MPLHDNNSLLQSYLQSLPADSSLHQQTGTTSSFGDSAEMADELGALVVAGIKSATCSALWEWEAEGNPIPQVGDKFIILDGNGGTLCIIETTEVRVRPYNEVNAQFARDEGEATDPLPIGVPSIGFSFPVPRPSVRE